MRVNCNCDFGLFCSAFVTVHQHSGQQVTDHPTKREAANKSKRGAANTGARSSAEDESGGDRDGESRERFVPDELLQSYLRCKAEQIRLDDYVAAARASGGRVSVGRSREIAATSEFDVGARH